MTSLRIALRYLFAPKSHQAVNIISRVAVVGVAVATAAIVCVLSVFNGFSWLTASRLSLLDPDVKLVAADGKALTRADSLAIRVAELPEVDMAVPVIEEQALAAFDNRQMPVVMLGVPEGFDSIVPVQQVMIDGVYGTYDGDYACANLSIGVAIRLGARPGFITPMALYVPRRKGRINPAALTGAFRTDSLLVSGVYELEQAEYDIDRVIVPIDVARHLLDYDSDASSIYVKLAPGVDPSSAIASINRLEGSQQWVAQDRLMQHEEAYHMIEIEKWITFMMLAFILIVASFNVISTMSMLIIEKMDNLATLRALGATPSLIGSIFAWEGWLISVTGGIAGIVIGIALCLAQQWGGFIKLNGDPSQLSITSYPVQVEVSDIAVVALLLVVVGLLTGLIASSYAKAKVTSH